MGLFESVKLFGGEGKKEENNGESNIEEEITRINGELEEIDKNPDPDQDLIEKRRVLESRLDGLKETKEKGFESMPID